MCWAAVLLGIPVFLGFLGAVLVQARNVLEGLAGLVRAWQEVRCVFRWGGESWTLDQPSMPRSRTVHSPRQARLLQTVGRVAKRQKRRANGRASRAQ